jgi:hypothetical protein
VFPLLPYLPLPDHKMAYYLAVPSIGIAIMGAYALGSARSGWQAEARPTKTVRAALGWTRRSLIPLSG